MFMDIPCLMETFIHGLTLLEWEIEGCVSVFVSVIPRVQTAARTTQTVCLSVCVSVSVCVCVSCVSISVCLCVCFSVSVRVYVCVCLSVCVCLCVCVLSHVPRHNITALYTFPVTNPLITPQTKQMRTVARCRLANSHTVTSASLQAV
jgi:hypothetical protein